MRATTEDGTTVRVSVASGVKGNSLTERISIQPRADSGCSLMGAERRERGKRRMTNDKEMIEIKTAQAEGLPLEIQSGARTADSVFFASEWGGC